MSTAPVADDGTAGLTDIEKEFLNFDESGLKDEDVPKPQDPPAPAAVVDPAVPADGSAAAVVPDPAAAPAPVADSAVAAAAPAAEPAAAPAPAADPVAQPSPFLVIQAPADAKEKLAKIAEDKAALATEFDAGDITGSVFQQRLDALNKDERGIELAVNNAELTAKMEYNRAKQAWDNSCDAFFKEAAASVYADPKAFEAFNENVKAMASMPRNRGLTERQLLERTDTMTRAELGLPPVVAAAKPDAAAAAAAAKELPKPQPQLPPNIGSLPAADVTDTNGGQYAHLDRLASTDPIAYEEAVAKLSDSARDAYFKAG